jgi:nicotinamide-nucleotide amidase
MLPDSIEDLSSNLGFHLSERSLRISTAESCTGGWIAQAITSVAGSSQWFDLGLVTYSNFAKQQQLGVSASLLEQEGAVSEAVVLAMAEGALNVSNADISIAVTGIAGPDGGSGDKPVGTVWVAWCIKGAAGKSRSFLFTGDRGEIRRQTVVAALKGAISFFES